MHPYRTTVRIENHVVVDRAAVVVEANLYRGGLVAQALLHDAEHLVQALRTFDANNGFSGSGALRVGRALEELGYWWFEEPLQHYPVRQLASWPACWTSPSPPATRPTRLQA